VRIGIDARKLHDFGIGTYIRNLLRELAALDHDTEYVILSRPGDDVAVRCSGRTSVRSPRPPVTTRLPSKSGFRSR